MKIVGIAVVLIFLLITCGHSISAQTLQVLECSADETQNSQCESDNRQGDSDNRQLSSSYCCRWSADCDWPANSRVKSGPYEGEFRCPCFTIESTSEITRPDFVYTVTLRNQGQRTVAGVEWEYIFIAPNTQAEVARHQFLNEEKIKPGQRRTLTAHSLSPPTRVVSVRMLSEPAKFQSLEQVTIKRIVYQDGSSWESKSSNSLQR